MAKDPRQLDKKIHVGPTENQEEEVSDLETCNLKDNNLSQQTPGQYGPLSEKEQQIGVQERETASGSLSRPNKQSPTPIKGRPKVQNDIHKTNTQIIKSLKLQTESMAPNFTAKKK